LITSYSFGRIEIDDKLYSNDVKILPDRTVVADWWRREGHELCLEDIKDIVKASPEVLVVGTGGSGKMAVLPEVAGALAEAGVELIVERTGEAWMVFNDLCTSKKVAAAFHLTC
jgi:hypothetical protein